MTNILLLTVFAAIAVGMVLLIRANRRLRETLRSTQIALEASQLQAERIADATQEALLADLHDDLGATILDLVYSAPDAAFRDRLRALLQDLRDIVTRARATPGTLEETLAQIESEARERLAVAGLVLDWGQELATDTPPLSKPLLFHLFRLFREAITNTLKHARATTLQVRLHSDGTTLRIEIRDNGTMAGSQKPGQGKDNMRARADQLKGSVTWRAATQGGTKVLMAIPLHGPVPR